MENRRMLATGAAAVAAAALLQASPRARAQSVPLGGGAVFSEWTPAQSLGPALNTPSTDGCPFIAKNGTSLYFASNRPGGMGGLDIYVSQRADAGAAWGPPQNLGPAVNTAANELCPTLSIDGHSLYMVSDRPGGCGGQDIYVAWRRHTHNDLGWWRPENLGCGVNSSANDFTPSLLEDEDDGETLLFFSSSRPGGMGGVDIYVSAADAYGRFGGPQPVDDLNTPWDDQRPNVRRDGLEIFFDSNRPGTLGSSDLWTSTRSSIEEPWSPPTNLGPTVNSAGTEGRPSLSHRGTELYFMSSRSTSTPSPSGTPSTDLYMARRRR